MKLISVTKTFLFKFWLLQHNVLPHFVLNYCKVLDAISYSQYDINMAIRIEMKDPELLDKVILHKLFGRSLIEDSGDDNIKPEVKEQYEIANIRIRKMLKEAPNRPSTPWQKLCDLRHIWMNFTNKDEDELINF